MTTEPPAPPPSQPFPPDPDKLKKIFEGWWGLGGAVVASVATALAAIGFDKDDAAVAAGLGLTVTAGVSGLFWWRRRRAPRSVRRPVAPEAVKARTSGFRLLQRFREGDQLPGDLRRRLAEDLTARVTHDEFDLIVVHGESGAGKSSLLAAGLAAGLGAAGHPVELVRTLAGTAGERAGVAPVVDRLADLTARLRGNSERKAVLILDQFEELLARLRDDDERRSLGHALRAAIDGGVGVVIGIRKEHLDDLFDVTAHIGREFSTKEDLFRVRNFTLSEAANVIAECAARDGHQLDPALADMIVTDIATDQTVRPADLQVVCSMLHGELTEANYLKNLRAVGLRSRFIQHYAEDTGNPTLALTILRALCDVPAASKRAPQAASELLDIARAGAPGPAVTALEVERTLRTLRDGWIVVDNGDPETPRWSLLHDYLVEPIKLATDAMATAAQKATAELDHHLRQAGSGTVIPLDRLRIIRRDVPPARLLDQDVRRLVRRSLVRGYGRPTAVYGLTAVVCLTGFALATTNYGVWGEYGERVSHWGDDEAGSDWRVESFAELNGQYVVTSSDGIEFSTVTIWDRETGAIMRVSDGAVLASVFPSAPIKRSIDIIGFRLKKIIKVNKNVIEVKDVDQISNDYSQKAIGKDDFRNESIQSGLAGFYRDINIFKNSGIFGYAEKQKPYFVVNVMRDNHLKTVFSSEKYLRKMTVKIDGLAEDFLVPVNTTRVISEILTNRENEQCCVAMFFMENLISDTPSVNYISPQPPPRAWTFNDVFDPSKRNEIERQKLENLIARMGSNSKPDFVFSEIHQVPGVGFANPLLLLVNLESGEVIETSLSLKTAIIDTIQTPEERIIAVWDENVMRLMLIVAEDFTDPSHFVKRLSKEIGIPVNKITDGGGPIIISKLVYENGKVYLKAFSERKHSVCRLRIEESVSISNCHHFEHESKHFLTEDKNKENFDIPSSKRVPFDGEALAVWRRPNNELMIWQAGRDGPVTWQYAAPDSVTHISVPSDHKGLIAGHSDGRTDIWFRGGDEPSFSPVRTIDPNLKVDEFFFTDDNAVILVRLRGGEYRAWTRTGEEFGSLGALGSKITRASYSEACRRLFVWTEDGERIEFRRGVELPGRLFIPWSRLAGTGPECVTAGEIPLPPAIERAN